MFYLCLYLKLWFDLWCLFVSCQFFGRQFIQFMCSIYSMMKHSIATGLWWHVPIDSIDPWTELRHIHLSMDPHRHKLSGASRGIPHSPQETAPGKSVASTWRSRRTNGSHGPVLPDALQQWQQQFWRGAERIGLAAPGACCRSGTPRCWSLGFAGKNMFFWYRNPPFFWGEMMDFVCCCGLESQSIDCCESPALFHQWFKDKAAWVWSHQWSVLGWDHKWSHIFQVDPKSRFSDRYTIISPYPPIYHIFMTSWDVFGVSFWSDHIWSDLRKGGVSLRA